MNGLPSQEPQSWSRVPRAVTGTTFKRQNPAPSDHGRLTIYPKSCYNRGPIIRLFSAPEESHNARVRLGTNLSVMTCHKLVDLGKGLTRESLLQENSIGQVSGWGCISTFPSCSAGGRLPGSDPEEAAWSLDSFLPGHHSHLAKPPGTQGQCLHSRTPSLNGDTGQLVSIANDISPRRRPSR